jgi:YD repeat-containing protein
VTQVTDRDGRVTQYGYDADDRPTTEKWMSGGTTLRTITTTYDYGGRVTQIQDPDSKYAYTYDNADRLLTVDDNGTSSLPGNGGHSAFLTSKSVSIILSRCLAPLVPLLAG